MKKGGLSLTKGMILIGLLFLFYGVMTFIDSHGDGVIATHFYHLCSIVLVTLGSIALWGVFLGEANDKKLPEQRKVSNWLMGSAAVFLLLIALERCNIWDTSVLGASLGVFIYRIPKAYIYEILLILIYPLMLTYITKAIGTESVISKKARSAYLQIAVLTLMEFLLVMTLDSVWIVEMAIFNAIAFLVAINHSAFGKNLSNGNKAAILTIYIVAWTMLLFVYSGNGFLRPDQYFFENSWDLYRKNIYEIMKHASVLGMSPSMTASENIRNFLLLNPENSMIWLLFYGGWCAVGVYVAALAGFVYLLYKTLCPSISKVNRMYPVYLIAFLSVLCRVVCGLLQNFGILPIPVNLPFSTEFGLVKDTFAVVILAIVGNLNHYLYWDWAILEEWEKLFEDHEELENTPEEYTEDEEVLDEEEKTAKLRNFFRNVVVILTLVLIVGTWCGTLSWLHKRVLTVDEYSMLEKQQYREEMKEVYGEYTDFILYKGYAEEFADSVSTGTLYYEIADIDNNGIPELLMSDGNYTRAATRIYTLQGSEVVYLGSYSQYGKLSVYKGKDHSIICSEYGGHGAFTEVYTKMENGTMEVVGVFFCDATGMESEEILYYAGFPYTQNVRADLFELDYEAITAEHLVSEEEYFNAQEAILNTDDYVEEVYTCPNEISLENEL